MNASAPLRLNARCVRPRCSRPGPAAADRKADSEPGVSVRGCRHMSPIATRQSDDRGGIPAIGAGPWSGRGLAEPVTAPPELPTGTGATRPIAHRDPLPTEAAAGALWSRRTTMAVSFGGMAAGTSDWGRRADGVQVRCCLAREARCTSLSNSIEPSAKRSVGRPRRPSSVPAPDSRPSRAEPPSRRESAGAAALPSLRAANSGSWCTPARVRTHVVFEVAVHHAGRMRDRHRAPRWRSRGLRRRRRPRSIRAISASLRPHSATDTAVVEHAASTACMFGWSRRRCDARFCRNRLCRRLVRPPVMTQRHVPRS